MSYLEHLKRCYMHSKNKLPGSYTKEEIALHVTYADTYSKAEQMEGWTRFFGWVHENA
ncbi:hypothetical protein [Enterococcus faecium]|uniref:hypothetical protein n=1 Tax=Enterococcus faecium TaxID=1352 RepID=UPI0016100A02|nr:hypothetical protein [Enterococcus faecium]